MVHDKGIVRVIGIMEQKHQIDANVCLILSILYCLDFLFHFYHTLVEQLRNDLQHKKPPISIVQYGIPLMAKFKPAEI